MKRLTILLPFIAAFAVGALVCGRPQPADAKWAPIRVRPGNDCRATLTQLRLQWREAHQAEQAALQEHARAQRTRALAERDARELQALLAQARARIRALERELVRLLEEIEPLP